MEAAWAAARAGDQEGLSILHNFAADYRYSATAVAYLRELGAADEIPEAAQDPDFEAKAEMASWLAHPNEFGRVPDELELIDSRELFWPPTGDERWFWLFKYTYLPTEEELEDDLDEEEEDDEEFDDELSDDEEDEEEETGPDIGIGLVGSITFALFGESTPDLSPEDIYGLHCAWELEHNEDDRAPEDRTPESGRAILRLHNPGF
jgi:hypothetical protein